MAKKPKKYYGRLADLERPENLTVIEENDKAIAPSPAMGKFMLPTAVLNARLNEREEAETKAYKTTSKKKKEQDTSGWLQKGSLSTFDDGYDFGDITKTILGGTLGTAADVGVGLVKGLGNVAEGLADLIGYGIAGAIDAFGDEEYADGLRGMAQENTIDKWFAPTKNFVDQYSFLGDKGDSIAEGIGYVGTVIATGGLGKAAGLGTVGSTVLTSGVTGLSSMGSGMSEAYRGGATDGEALAYGTIAGLAEAGSELIFGGLGKATNALGLSKGLSAADDALAKKVTSKMTNQLAKNFTEYGIKAGAEGFEEVASGVMQALGKKVTYMSEEELGQIIKDENLMDQFIAGAVTSGIAQSGYVPGMKAGSIREANKAGTDFITGYTANEQTVIDSLVNEQVSGIAKQNALTNELNKAIESKEAEQGGILSAKEKNALKSKIEAQIANGELDISSTKVSNKDISKIRAAVEENMQKGLLDTNAIESVLGKDADLSNDGYLQRSYIEQAKRKEAFTYENKTTDAKEKAVYESATKYFNNTTRSHEFVDRVAKIAKDKGTNYGFINNEELQSLGHDVEGKQVNGLVRTNKDGEQTVLINIDSPKALETIVGHETTHLLEGTQEYQDLQEAIFNYAKDKGDYNERLNSLKSLYEGIENANVDSELTADLVGDYLFTDTDFINSLSTQKPTLFQRIKELIDDLVVRFTGTKEEKALREVQKKFKEAYRATNTKANTGTKYSLNAKDDINKLTDDGIKMTYVRVPNQNTQYYGSTYGQNIEPAGEYMSMDTLKGKSKIDGYEYGTIQFKKPLVLEHINTSDTGWKKTLSDKYNGLTGKKLSNAIKKDGYDAIMTVDEDGNYVEIVNLNGTKLDNNENNIKYSLSEKGEMVDSKGDKVTLEASDTGTHGTLMAIHNLNESKLQGILELGGFPFPSIAITNPSKINHSSYGDISVVFDKNTIDPANKKNKVYSRDAYTPRFPRLEYKADSAVIKNLRNRISKLGDYTNRYVSDANSFLDNIEDSLNNGGGIDGLIDRYKKNEALKYLYIKENGIPFEEQYKDESYSRELNNESLQKLLDSYKGNKDTLNDLSYEETMSLKDEIEQLWLESKFKTAEEKQFLEQNPDFTPNLSYRSLNSILMGAYKLHKYGSRQILDTSKTNDLINNRVNQEEFESWLRNELKDIVAKKGIRNNKDYYTPSGNPRSFEQLHDEYNLDNVVKIMTALNDTGAESFMMAGINEIAGNASIRFDSIAEIKAREDLIQNIDEDEYQAILDDIGDRLRSVENEIIERGHKNSDNPFMALDNLGSAISTMARKFGQSKRVTPSAITKELNEWGFYPTQEESQTILNMFSEMRDLPTEYFEAKPKRAVTFDEVQAIVIPNDTNIEFKQQLLDNGLNVIEYDPNVESDRQAKINELDDLKFSLSQQNEAAPKNSNLTYGEDIKLQVEEAITPLQEQIKALTEQATNNVADNVKVPEMPNMEQIAPITEVEYTQPTKAELDNLMSLMESSGTEYANAFFALRDKYGQRNLYKGLNQYNQAPDTYEAPIKGDEFAPIPQDIVEKQNQEAFNNIDESSMPAEPEDTTPDTESEMTATESLFETRSYEDVGDRKVNAYQYDNPEVKPYFQEAAQQMLYDLDNSIKGERIYNDEAYYNSNGEIGWMGTKRHTTDDIAELLDGMDGRFKLQREDIRKGLNAIINDEGSENNAASKRIEFYLDQRLREGYTTVDGYEIPANQEYIKMMAANEITDTHNSMPIDDSMMPVENVEKPVAKVSNSKPVENIGPVKEEYLAITPEKEPKLKRVSDNPEYNKIAEVLTTEPKTESDRNKRKWAIFKANVLDKGIVFEDLSLKENNRELIAKWDYTLTSEARGQYAIGNGHNGLSKSLNDIRAEVENTGNTKDFYNYMYHKHNVDRMSLVSKAQEEIKRLQNSLSNLTAEQIQGVDTNSQANEIRKEIARLKEVKNKPVFGDSVTAEQSQAIVNEYEKTHPEFLEFAQDVYDYVNADRQLLVDNGVISQETADLWSKMYPHYVPTRRVTDTGIDINVPLDTRKTGINAPIKKATGGNSNILPLFDTMAMRTLQTYRATAKNSFGVELMNTMGTTIESAETNVDEVIDSIEAQDGLLQEGKKGNNPTFTVFDGGEKITFEITKDMYDALKPVSESSLLSKTIKPLNVAGNIRRGLLTEYNPTFMLTNAIKDTQDILLNSQHATKTYLKIPEAHKQLLTKGYWYNEYVANGGEQNSYFDNETNTFKTENKGISKLMDIPPLSTISKINNHIEMIPRLAEYIASREAGRSIEVSMLDAARVTTNFKAGGAVTKWANRNGATFLNASVQGAMQQVRNIREAKANGIRGWVNLATKFAVAGLPAVILNNLVWEDDEEYEELSDYVKQNYYVVGKSDDGTFIRIPKGRTVAVIQEAINQMGNLITGDDEADLKSFIDLTINNLAPNNPLDNNVFSPIIQAATNTAWYGGDLVPTRLQNLPTAEQYDESTDMFSRWVGETFNVSPYKVNYLLDQYSGGVGDVFLPMMTPEAESDGDSLGDYLLAPLRSKFTTNSTTNNQNISDFYDTSEELTINANKSGATDNDVLSNKYINAVKAEMNELYKEKREIQNSSLSNSEKYEKVLEIQSQINELAENALSEYTNVQTASNYSTVGDREYYKRINSEGEVEWTKVNDEEAEDLNNMGFTRAEKNTYFSTKSEISSIVKDYKDDKEDFEDLDEDSDEYKDAISRLSSDKKEAIVNKIKGTGFSDEQKAYLYKKYYNTDTIDTIVSSGVSVDAYLDYCTQDIKADKDKEGDSIPNSRKKKVIAYVNSLDLSVPEKAILIKATNTFKFNDYNNAIVEYVGGLDISYEEKVDILEELDMTVSNGRVYWK